MTKIHFFLVLLLPILITCAGRCGPSNYVPESPADCVQYSNSTTACCYLTMLDAPAKYNICYYLNLNDVTPIISIGRLYYRVDCEGIVNFTQYFPLENLYLPCGVQNPLSPKDCWPYTTGSGACCMAGSNPLMNGDDDPFCYFFPEAKFDKINFTVDTNIAGLKYYVSCKGTFLVNLWNAIIMFTLLIIIFF